MSIAIQSSQPDRSAVETEHVETVRERILVQLILKAAHLKQARLVSSHTQSQTEN